MKTSQQPLRFFLILSFSLSLSFSSPSAPVWWVFMLIKYKQKWPFVALVNFPSMVLINPDIAQSQAINLCLFPTALSGWIIEQQTVRETYIHTCAQTGLRVRSHIPVRNPVLGVWSCEEFESDDGWCRFILAAVSDFTKSVNNAALSKHYTVIWAKDLRFVWHDVTTAVIWTQTISLSPLSTI